MVVEEKGITDLTNYQIQGFDEVGFINFGKIAKSLGKAVKSVGKGIAGVAKVAVKIAATVGPAVALAFPGLGQGIQMATGLLDGVANGDPEAIARQSAIAAGAATGNPRFQQAAQYIDIAKAAQRQVQAVSTLTQAKQGVPQALQRVESLRRLAMQPDAPAHIKAAYAAFQKAATGIQLAKKV